MARLTSIRRLAAAVSILSAVLIPSLRAQEAEAPDARNEIAYFDMDEPYQDLPEGFDRVRGQGYYHWIRVALDRKLGHDAAPSLRIDLNRGNGGCEQQYKRVGIRPFFNYRLEAWVRTSGLKQARAYVTAFFSDAFGKKIPETLRVSELLGGDNRPRWQRISLLLSADDPRYGHISFGLWLTQPWKIPGARQTDGSRTPADIHGSAWFDDIRIYALPKIRLYTAAPGNVFTADEKVSLKAEISGVRFKTLMLDLRVYDADRRQVLRHRQPLAEAAGRVHKISTPPADLPGGWYRAVLRLEDGGRRVSRREIAFVRLPSVLGRASQRGKQFGIVLDAHLTAGSPAAEILGRIGVGRCKLPLWHAALTNDQVLYLRPEVADLLMALTQRRIRCMGVLAAAPPLVRENLLRRVDSMADVFDADEDHWKHPLAMTLTYYAAKINQWQLGADADAGFAAGTETAAVLRQVAPTIEALVAQSKVGLPWPGMYSTRDPALDAAQFVALYLDQRTDPTAVRHLVADATADASRNVWVTLAPLPAAGYRRRPRLIRFARRVIESLAGGAKGVYIPQPWVNRSADEGGPQPDELTVIYHTLADQLGGARFIGRLRLHENVQCFVFDRGHDALLVGWVDRGLTEKITSSLYLGGEARYVDLWGAHRPVQRVEGKAAVTFTPSPVFISGIDARIARVRESFKITPRIIDSDFVTHQGEIAFVNGFQQSITGTVRLRLPRGWHITPRVMRFVLAPGEAFRRKIALRFPFNATAGGKLLRGEFQIDGERTYNFAADAPFELNLAGTTARLFARVRGDKVLVDLGVTNFRDDQRQFDCIAMAPGRPTQQRSIGSLTRGRTVVKRFVFANPATLVGKRVRVTLREIDGSHVANYEAEVR